mgnify:CR=1 FL=1
MRDYNLSLACELAAAGVDEIQFDYVRFPTNGWRGDWQGALETTAARRREVILALVLAVFTSELLLHDTATSPNNTQAATARTMQSV